MKISGGLMVGFFLALTALSCFDPPEYPAEPQISFKEVRFLDGPDQEDSLVLELFFRDGDGDLGLSPQETGCYASSQNARICFDGQLFEVRRLSRPTEAYGLIPLGQSCTTTDANTICLTEKFFRIANDRLVNYAQKRTNPQFASLPNFVKPFDCINWEFDRNPTNQQVIDTLYIELNPDHYNIFIDFLVKQPDGSFQEYDFRKEFCTTYDGRFPILSKNLDQPTPLEGVVRYAMPGLGFNLVFSIKTLKLRIQIQDRLLNKSNVIETPEFTLQSIRR